MVCKESICRNCFHSYVCEQFNENKDDNNEKCHFANDHYIPRADVVPKSEVEWLYQQIDNYSQEVMYYDEITKMKVDEAKFEVAREIFEEIEAFLIFNRYGIATISKFDFAELKKKYIGGKK